MVSSYLFRSLSLFFSLFSATASCTSVLHHHVSSFFPALPEVTPSTSFATTLIFILVSSQDHASCNNSSFIVFTNFSLCSSSFSFHQRVLLNLSCLCLPLIYTSTLHTINLCCFATASSGSTLQSWTF